jgi:hypothetical protein
VPRHAENSVQEDAETDFEQEIAEITERIQFVAGTLRTLERSTVSFHKRPFDPRFG